MASALAGTRERPAAGGAANITFSSHTTVTDTHPKWHRIRRGHAGRRRARGAARTNGGEFPVGFPGSPMAPPPPPCAGAAHRRRQPPGSPQRFLRGSDDTIAACGRHEGRWGASGGVGPWAGGIVRALAMARLRASPQMSPRFWMLRSIHICTSGLCLQAFQTTAATVGAWHARTRLTPTRAPTLPPPPTVRHAGGRSDSWDKLLTAAEERVAVKQEMCECWYTIFILLLSVGTNTIFPTFPPPPGRLRTLSSYSPRGDGSCLRPVLRDRGEGKALLRGQRQTTVGGGAAAGARRRPSPATLLRLPPLLQNLEQMRGVVEKACRC